MFKRVKYLTFGLILATMLVLLVFPGCGGEGTGTTTSELTAQELEQVLADSLNAVKNTNTYEFSLVMDMNIEAIGGSQAGTMDMIMTSSGSADIAANKMKMDMDVSVKLNVPEAEEDSQSLSAEIYMLDDWIYMKMDVMGTGAQWIKSPLTEDIEQAYGLDMINQQLAPLESMAEIQFVKYETVDSAPCYVLNIVPDLAAMKDWFSEQGMLSMTMGWDPSWELLENMFKDLSYNVWVAKDTKLMKKMIMVMKLELTPEQVDASASDFEKMTIDANMDMELKHYNEPVSIELPEEAENAVEM